MVFLAGMLAAAVGLAVAELMAGLSSLVPSPVATVGDVFIDGRFVGQTPLAAQKLPPGNHTIRVRHNDSGKEQRRKINLAAGADTLERFDLR